MIRTSAAVLFAMLGFVAAIFAQTGPQLPKPGDELKRLDYFAGNWIVHGEGTSGIKFTRKSSCVLVGGWIFLGFE